LDIGRFDLSLAIIFTFDINLRIVILVISYFFNGIKHQTVVIIITTSNNSNNSSISKLNLKKTANKKIVAQNKSDVNLIKNNPIISEKYNNNFNPLSPINSTCGEHLSDSRNNSDFEQKRLNVLTPGSNISRVRIMSRSQSSYNQDRDKDLGENNEHVMILDNKLDLENNLKK
jgi:hypothetical protein